VTAGGKNVPPANIELRFADDPLIAHVVVYGDGKRTSWRACGSTRPPAAASARGRGARSARRAAALVRAAVDGQRQLASYETIKRFASCHAPHGGRTGCSRPTLKVRARRCTRPSATEFEASTRPLCERRRPTAAAPEAPAQPPRPAGAPKPVVGATPADVVYRENKWRLLRYRPRPRGPRATDAGAARAVADQPPLRARPAARAQLRRAPRGAGARRVHHRLGHARPTRTATSPSTTSATATSAAPRHASRVRPARQGPRAGLLPGRHAHGHPRRGAPRARRVAHGPGRAGRFRDDGLLSPGTRTRASTWGR
jgi:hypothetical protein